MSLLVAVSVFIFVSGVLGIFGNINLIVATVIVIEHRTKCTILIGILACCDLICIVFEWANAVEILLKIETFRRSCFWSISPYLYVINVQSMTILMIAVDRLFAIWKPIKYRSFGTTKYVLMCLTPGILCATVIFTASVVTMDDEQITACNPPLGYPPLVSFIWNKWIIGVDTCTILLYVVTMGMLYVRKKQFSKLDKMCSEYQFFVQQQHIMRTISVIVIAFTCSWFFCHCSVLLVTYIGLSGPVVQFFQTVAVVPAMMCYCQNYYIYLWRSHEYRTAFKRQFVAAIHCNSSYCHHTSSVSVVHSIYSSQ
ncbi:hypothetical protein QR680_015008 [Steinernema hermaphroditum]|uniref:G-protein coupled receptors family 1 profile domain-containing protein n=1 Tax=Steinernema hermaphroditum TaxID=289476 RepID=A0AA39M460_9BILA|nr:hypothetical protein QR680_015008 [Steinernema hermaphroditum]